MAKKNNLDSLTKTINKESSRGGEGWGFLELLGIGVGAANLPLGALLIVGSYVGAAASSSKHKSETVMPDDWLQKVSDSPEASKRGLAFLAKRLDKKGFITVKDAEEWANIEKSEALKKEAKKAREEGIQTTGAQALLARAEKECSGLLGNLNMDSAMKSITDAAKNNWSFSLNFNRKKPSSGSSNS